MATKETSGRQRKRKKLTALPRGTRWKSLVARTHIMVYIVETHPHMDCSRMTEEWWQANVKNNKSMLLATCTKCGYDKSRPRISDLKQGGGCPCFCNGSVPYTTRDAYELLMKRIKNDPKHKRMDCSRMTWEWWQANVNGCYSKLLATCNSCGYDKSRPLISNIKQRKCFPCFCNGSVPYTTRDAYEWLMERIKNNPKHKRMDCSRMTWEWWQANVKGNKSRLLATCNICGYDKSRPLISNIKQRKRFPCFCNGKVPYTTRDAYEWLMERIKNNPKHKLMDCSRMTWEWWQANVKGKASKLLATCNICGYDNSQPLIHNIQQRKAFPCGCKNKTEAFVYDILREYIPTTSDTCGHNPVRGLRRKLDYIVNHNTAGELDGRQHFEAIGVFDHEGTWCGDCEKQTKLVEDAWCLFRLEQEWVWENMGEPWLKDVILELVRLAMKAPPRTLLLLDVHRKYYEGHVQHWCGCRRGEARVWVYKLDELIARTSEDIRSYCVRQ